ncbi:transposase [Streptomyces tendae]|uniref:transposase n=1 Tax=Streptomyces tendae TaxID=1932 RepID=UPI0037158218
MPELRSWRRRTTSTRALRRKDVDVARCTVERLMVELGIEGVIRGRRRALPSRSRRRLARRTAHEETTPDAGQPQPVCGACSDPILPTERACPHLWEGEAAPYPGYDGRKPPASPYDAGGLLFSQLTALTGREIRGSS